MSPLLDALSLEARAAIKAGLERLPKIVSG
jgi:hypothetical protein